MLVSDKADKALVEAYLVKQGKNWDHVQKYDEDWLWARVKRYIPEKELLYVVLEEFFDAWGHTICSKSHKPLFDNEIWAVTKGVLHNVRKGWLSDPPGISLYTLLGYDKHGLALYHCIRGTNSVEVGVHNPIRCDFASLNEAAELADFKHLDVGVFHKIEKRYIS